MNIGDVPIGGNNPIRIQSMTTTNTMDTQSTVDQSIRMIEAGSDYVRITTPSLKEAKNLFNIKKQLKNLGYNTPIIADIHFTPSVAMEAAKIVEKIRINPGNFVDRKKFKNIEYTDKSYSIELNRIHDLFKPLVLRCKEEGCAMRIGSNHGSLSDRILSRYGDTPFGMVESAMEFLRICELYNYYDIVLSMKASNTRVMVQAYRLLVNQMIKEDMNYPLHLGVTEAGEGEDGRIKSAVGIGTLLEDGLGDTIRVSLTEEPEYEIPIAKEIVNRYDGRLKHDLIKKIDVYPLKPFEYNKRNTKNILNIGGDNVIRNISNLSNLDIIEQNTLDQIGYKYYEKEDKWGINDFATDYIYIGNNDINFNIPGSLSVIQDYIKWKEHKKDNIYPIFNYSEFENNNQLHPILNFVSCDLEDFNDNFFKNISSSNIVLIIETRNIHGMAEQRRLFINLINLKLDIPIIISRSYNNLTEVQMQIYSSIDFGALLIDGLGDGILINSTNSLSLYELNQLAFGVLQASRNRISKTEYISCPSCGRTLFDLQLTTAKVREKTSHLKGLKIGIMGCIVNGPGEMADADYGYVGTGQDKITLYRGYDIVKANIPSDIAVNELINIIKEDNLWIEPEILSV